MPNQKLQEGLNALGVHCGEIPRNCSPEHTCGHCCYGCPSGDKQDMTGTYLSDAAGHGARILTGKPSSIPQPGALPTSIMILCADSLNAGLDVGCIPMIS